MCALRDYRSISAVSLANQYRLDVKPKRPIPKRLTRNKKRDTEHNELEEKKEIVEEINTYLPKREDSLWMLNVDDYVEDYDFDADDDFLDSPVDNRELSQRYYVQACTDLNIRPVKCIYNGLALVSLVCKGYIMKKDEVKACTIALVGNSICENIVFDANQIGPEAGTYFADVLSRNVYLVDVKLTWNDLGSEGAKTICSALLKNTNVKRLDLTGFNVAFNNFLSYRYGVYLRQQRWGIMPQTHGNRFRETDAKYFRELLEENSGIHELFLGHNYFREAGGEQIAEGLAQNYFIKVLDLSWNHLRLKGAMAIGKALKTNTQLEVLNVAWNGFYLHGIVHLAQALSHNQTLLDIDISCNRLSEFCIRQFLDGMKNNNTLKRLHMALNHISHVGAVSILQFLKANPSVVLDYIDLGDQHVHEDFIEIHEELKESRDLTVLYGTVWSRDRDPIGKQDQSEDEVALLNENPHFVLMEFMRLQKLRLIDLFHQMDKDNSKGISVDEFFAGLQAVDIPLKRKSLEKFVSKCDTDKNGEIEYSELVQANLMYKAVLRKHVKANTPVEETDIGRIQKLIRKIMYNNGKTKLPLDEDLKPTEQQENVAVQTAIKIMTSTKK